MKKINLILKRIFDISISLFSLLILFPAFILIAVIIKISSKGSVFFYQIRVGKNRKLFKIIKFRTMQKDLVAENAMDIKIDIDRITGIGKFLRRYKIDELPQLINVFIGDMSLVGPRPTVLIHVNEYNNHQLKRLEMRPGMTGFAQVNGNTALSWDERINLDILYIKKYNIFLDFRIIFKTFFVIIKGEDTFK